MTLYLSMGDLLERVNALIEECVEDGEIYIFTRGLVLLSTIYHGIKYPKDAIYIEREWIGLKNAVISLSTQRGSNYRIHLRIASRETTWSDPNDLTENTLIVTNAFLGPRYFVHPEDIFQREPLSSFVGSFRIQMALDHYRLMILILSDNRVKNPLTKLSLTLRRLLFTYLT